MLKHGWFVGFGLVLAAAGAVLVAAERSGSPAGSRRATSDERAVDAVADRGSASSDESAAIRAQTYRLSFQQEFVVHGGAPSRARVSATLEITPRDAAGRDLVKLGPVAIEGTETPPAAELAVVFARRRDASGHLEALELPRGTSPEARRYLRAIASALEYTLAPGEAWESVELDVGGRFASSYRRRDDGRVERYRRRFLENPANQGVSANVRLDGRTLVTLDGDGTLQALETDERAELSAGDSWRLDAKLSVALTRQADVDARWAKSPGALERQDIVERTAGERPAASTDRARLRGRSLADLRGELESVDQLTKSMERTRERSRLMQDHAALARLDQAALGQMAARLQDPATPESERSLLAGSLAATATPEASHALAEVVKSAPLADARLHAAVALNVSPAQDAETLASLEAGTKDPDPDVAGTSALALGNALRTYRSAGGTSPASAEALARAYANARSIEERTSALSAIGNSGDDSLLPLVEHALTDQSPQIQETATFALRFMGSAADPLLGQALSSPFPEVRDAAERAMKLRSTGARG